MIYWWWGTDLFWRVICTEAFDGTQSSPSATMASNSEQKRIWDLSNVILTFQRQIKLRVPILRKTKTRMKTTALFVCGLSSPALRSVVAITLLTDISLELRCYNAIRLFPSKCQFMVHVSVRPSISCVWYVRTCTVLAHAKYVGQPPNVENWACSAPAALACSLSCSQESDTEVSDPLPYHQI